MLPELKQLNDLEARQITDREIIVLKLNLTMNAVEIGEKLGLSKQRIHQILAAAKKKQESQH